MRKPWARFSDARVVYNVTERTGGIRVIAQDNVSKARFKVYAATDIECGGLEYVRASTHPVLTPDEAEAIAAQFPMSIGLRAHRFTGRPGVPEAGEVVLHADLCANKSRVGVDEDGVKRYRAFREHAERLGHEVGYDPGQLRGAPDVVCSEDDFENRLRALREHGAAKARLWNPQETPAWPVGQGPESARRVGASGPAT